MKLIATRINRTSDGKTQEKWLPSYYYYICVETLLLQIQKDTTEAEYLIIPYILTLCASLESSINDWIIIDTINKYGYENYKVIADGYVCLSLSKKLRIAVAIMTNNKYQLKEESPTVKILDKLISDRNKITHPVEHFAKEEDYKKGITHPLARIGYKECKDYFIAVKNYYVKFFGKYDKKRIRENELIRKINRK